MKRNLRFALIAAGLAVFTAHAQTTAYPAKSVRLIVGYTPGGGTDVLSRVLAKYLGDTFRQTVVVDNRPGAGGILATEITAKAPPDGYTLLTTPSSHAINPGLYGKLPYDSIRDFTVIGLIATSPNVLVVHPSVPVKSVRDLVPQGIVEKLNGEIARIMNLPEVRKLVLAQGAEPWTSTPQEFAEYMQRETALYTRIIREAGIKVE